MGSFLTRRLSLVCPVSYVSRGRRSVSLDVVRSAGRPLPLAESARQITWEELIELGGPPNSSCIFLVCVKAYDLEIALSALHSFVDVPGAVALCCNGLGVGALAERVLGTAVPVVRVLPEIGVRRVEAGVFGHVGGERIRLSSNGGSVIERDRVAACLRAAGFKAEIDASIEESEWQKARVNLVINTICTLHDVSNGYILPGNPGHALAHEVVSEVQSIIQRIGHEVSSWDERVFFDELVPHAENVNSTLSDLRNGKPSELPWILGPALLVARNYGVPVPRLEELADSLGRKNLAVWPE